MHYVCVENSVVSSILSYEPNVPESVKVYKITNSDYEAINAGTKTFDTATNKVVPVKDEILKQKETEKANSLKQHELSSSDWKVMRHIREKALGLKTTLTDSEYIALETKRENIAKSIIK